MEQDLAHPQCETLRKRHVSRRGRPQFRRGRRRLKELTEISQMTPVSSHEASTTARYELVLTGSQICEIPQVHECLKTKTK